MSPNKKYQKEEKNQLNLFSLTFFSKNSPLKGATAISCATGTSLPPSNLNLKTRGMPFGIPTLQGKIENTAD